MRWLLLHTINRLPAGQRGFTLVEIVSALGIMVIIGPIIVGSLYQMQTTTARGSAQLSTEADSRTSMQWLTRDFRMAQTTNLVDGGPIVSCATLTPNPCLSLGWTDQYNDTSVSHAVTYAMVGKEFKRTYDGTTHTVARNVTVVDVSLQGRLVTISLTSESDQWLGTSKDSTHILYLRPS